MKLEGLAAELYDEIAQIPVVDCHEHLPTEKERIEKPTDVTHLFKHYCLADLNAAGLDMGRDPGRWRSLPLFDASQPLMPRWAQMKPAFEAIRHGSYAYPALAYVRDVLGIPDIRDDTVEEISRRMQAEMRPGLYRRLMVERCGIRRAIQCTEGVVAGDQDFFVYLIRDRACGVPLGTLERETRRVIRTLDDYVDALGQYVAEGKKAGAAGYKVGAAYSRGIDFPDVPRGDAERVFCRLRAKVSSAVSDTDREALENYLLRRAVEACIENDLPVVIHTGYQAGVHNDIRNARATHLWSLLRDYPQARFDLFHGSFPYVEDMVVLGKYFENVSLNMCWMHIMSPEISRRALAAWLDAVPATKIFAFGGDYLVVEKVYGHLKLARADVALVLAKKVRQGRMTESEALKVARLLFHDNAVAWYKLS